MDIGAALWDGLRGSLPIILLAIGALVLFAILKGASSSRTKSFAAKDLYVRRTSLFTPTEAKFLATLRAAAPEHEVFGKVRLEDVVQARRGLSSSDRASARNRLKSRHLDFVLCQPGSTRIACVVELDDQSHESARAQASDRIKNEILQAASIPLLRVPASSTMDATGVARRLEALGVIDPHVEDAAPA